MSAIVLAPHNDDESLWTSFSILRERAHVIICLQSKREELRGEGITAEERNAETEAAVKILGGTVEFLPFNDATPDWSGMVSALSARITCETVYAPAIEPGGHMQHNMVGEIANSVSKTVLHYMTYTNKGKSTSPHRVPFEPWWAALKLKALACYTSQIRSPLYVDHFLREQYEYYAAA